MPARSQVNFEADILGPRGIPAPPADHIGTYPVNPQVIAGEGSGFPDLAAHAPGCNGCEVREEQQCVLRNRSDVGHGNNGDSRPTPWIVSPNDAADPTRHNADLPRVRAAAHRVQAGDITDREDPKPRLSRLRIYTKKETVFAPRLLGSGEIHSPVAGAAGEFLDQLHFVLVTESQVNARVHVTQG